MFTTFGIFCRRNRSGFSNIQLLIKVFKLFIPQGNASILANSRDLVINLLFLLL